MKKHTPGPYLAVRFFDQIAIQQNKTLPEGDRPEIAVLSLKSVVLTEEEQISNASLIAAAPEMLEALEALLDDTLKCGGTTLGSIEVSRKIKKAIAKAKGET